MEVTIHAREAGKGREFHIGADANHAFFLEVTNLPIDEIDLTPIKNCPHFCSLYLKHTNLTKLDLTPLRSCQELTFLSIVHNQIHTIDLAPLAMCPRLQNLYLDLIPVKFLDLTPLAHCSQLKVLHLSDLEISDIDLTPLAHCAKLQDISLLGNPFKKKIDLLPVTELPLKDLFLKPEFIQLDGSEEKKHRLVQLAKNSIASVDI